MHWIPDVPKLVQDQIERENFITQKALWEIKPEVKSQSSYNLNRFNLNVPRLSESGQETTLTQVASINERVSKVDDSEIDSKGVVIYVDTNTA